MPNRKSASRFARILITTSLPTMSPLHDETERRSRSASKVPQARRACAPAGFRFPPTTWPTRSGWIARCAHFLYRRTRLANLRAQSSAKGRTRSALLTPATHGCRDRSHGTGPPPLLRRHHTARSPPKPAIPSSAFPKRLLFGQEIVERVRSRGHVNKLLVSLEIDGELAPARGSKLVVDGKEIGEVTSAVSPPAPTKSPPLLMSGYRMKGPEPKWK